VYGFVRGQNFGRNPVQIADQLYYVGDRDTAVYALDTSDGIILIDGGYTDTARRVFANMREMRLDPARVRAILTTHAHFDHAAGLAYLHQQTGAPIYASADSAELLASGGERDFSRLMRTYFRFPEVTASEVVADRQPLQFGNLTITAHITRGHTRGCTTWAFPVTIDGAPHNALLLCSLTCCRNISSPVHARVIRASPTISAAALRGSMNCARQRTSSWLCMGANSISIARLPRTHSSRRVHAPRSSRKTERTSMMSIAVSPAPRANVQSQGNPVCPGGARA
jgi:hypothetical protein